MTLYPSPQQYQHESTNRRNRGAPKVAEAYVFVFVTPEYNFGPPPPLSSALNYLYEEWTINSPGSSATAAYPADCKRCRWKNSP
jgi:NAD(P)H-dependent FMN reductase